MTALQVSLDQQQEIQSLLDELESIKVIQRRSNDEIVIQIQQFALGEVSGTGRGMGVLIESTPVTSAPRKCYISSRQMEKLLDGDCVLARVGSITHGRSTRCEARIIDIVKPAEIDYLGRVVNRYEMAFVQPLYGNSTRFFPLMDSEHQLQPGCIVKFKVVNHPFYHQKAWVKVTQVVSAIDGPSVDIEIAIQRYGLPHSWSHQVTQQVSNITKTVTTENEQQRQDLRHLPFVTIDAEDAQDFDDAVYCEQQENQWVLWVAIADVSHYVTANTPLDDEALERGTSVYFPRRVIPMLPETLSNDLCSLKPNQDRYALVCKIDINASGEKQRYTFFKALICSAARLSYTQVHKACVDKEPAFIKTLEDLEVMTGVDRLYRLTQKLTANRRRHGLLAFHFPEPVIEFDSNINIQSISSRSTNTAHAMIEECMLLANICAAEMIETHRKEDAIFRNHPQPDVDSLVETRKILNMFGLSLEGDDAPKLSDYIATADKAMTHPSRSSLIHLALLRSFTKASYGNQAQGHFALGFPLYTHFTSPIRRYPDLVIHRLIKQITGQKHPSELSLKGETMASVAHRTSLTERRAEEAIYYAMARLKARFMQQYLDKQFTATIIAVKDFGLFVQLKTFFIEGLVHVTRLGRDYYRFNEDTYQLIGERSGQRFSLGDEIQVTVFDVDIDKGEIDFCIDQKQAGHKKQSNHKRQASHKKKDSNKKPASNKKQTSNKKKASNKKPASHSRKPMRDKTRKKRKPSNR